MHPYLHPPDLCEPNRNAVPVFKSQALMTTSTPCSLTSLSVALPKTVRCNAFSNAVVRLPHIGKERDRNASQFSTVFVGRPIMSRINRNTILTDPSPSVGIAVQNMVANIFGVS